MDQFFTSLNKRETMLLLTATTFGGQEGVAALDFLPEEQAELLKHRAQEILQIPRERRVPALVQELKRLVKDRRGMLWSADPARLAQLLQRERGALVEVMLRALPAALAEAVRAHLPPTGVKLTREVRPQVLDIIRWKLEEMLTREGAAAASFRFSDVLMMPSRELLTVCDRLGARVLGPAMAGLPEEERNALIAPLPPDLRQLATKAVTANAPRKLEEKAAREQLEVHGGLQDLGLALLSAGVQRLARACVSQSPEFAARMLERHRGDFGQFLARWIREERSKPPSRGDGGRSDIVSDLERLASRGYIERPMRMPQLPPKPAAPAAAPASAPRSPAEAASAPAPREPAAAPRVPGLPQTGRPGALPPPRRPAAADARREGSLSGAESPRRDMMAERAARRAGAMSAREPAPQERPPAAEEGAAEGARPQRAPPQREAAGSSAGPAPSPREASAVRRNAPVLAPIPVLKEGRAGAEAQASRVGPPPAGSGSRMGPPPAPEGSRAASAPARDGSRLGPPPGREPSRAVSVPARDGSRLGPPPSRDGSRMGPPPAPEGSRATSMPARDGSRLGPPPARDGSRSVSMPAREGSQVASRPPRPEGSSVRAPAPPVLQEADPEGSRVISSSAARGGSKAVSRSQPSGEPERPPRVLVGRATTSPANPAASEGGQGAAGQRRPRPATPGTPGRGSRGGTR